MRRIRPFLSAGLAVLALGAWGSTAQAGVTVGQLAPTTPTSGGCTNVNPFDILQPTVTSGNSYVIPNAYPRQRITAWSHLAGPTLNGTLAFKTFRTVTAPNMFQVVSHDGPRPIAPSTLNTFRIDLPATPGDIIGLNDGTADVSCLFAVPGETNRQRSGNLADGEPGAFNASGNARVNLTATVEPTNTFTTGAVSRSKKKGTATVDVTVPNPGEVTATGNGVQGAVASTAVAAPAPGTVKLTIRAQGKKKKKLKTKGKVNLAATITYLPTGGTAATQPLSLKLRKKLKR